MSSIKAVLLGWVLQEKQFHEERAKALGNILMTLHETSVDDDVVIRHGGEVAGASQSPVTRPATFEERAWMGGTPPPPAPSSGRPTGPNCECGQPANLWTSKDGGMRRWYCAKRKNDPSKCSFARNA